MKRCYRCGIEKSVDLFYRNPCMKDGRFNECKECTKRRVKVNRSENAEQYREYDRERGNRQSPGYIKDYRRRFPAKYIAHTAVNNSIRDGRITRESCAICGSDKSHAHHDDYAIPLSVRWLCAVHHKQWHTENGEGRNARQQ